MAFTYATITHQFTNADSTPSSGTVEFSISQAMTNGGVTIVPAAHVSSTLSSAGVLSQQLASTQDAGTFPTGCFWRVDFRIAGATTEAFYTPIPSGGVSIDLGSLMPFVTPAEPA